MQTVSNMSNDQAHYGKIPFGLKKSFVQNIVQGFVKIEPSMDLLFSDDSLVATWTECGPFHLANHPVYIQKIVNQVTQGKSLAECSVIPPSDPNSWNHYPDQFFADKDMVDEFLVRISRWMDLFANKSWFAFWEKLSCNQKEQLLRRWVYEGEHKYLAALLLSGNEQILEELAALCAKPENLSVLQNMHLSLCLVKNEQGWMDAEQYALAKVGHHHRWTPVTNQLSQYLWAKTRNFNIPGIAENLTNLKRRILTLVQSNEAAGGFIKIRAWPQELQQDDEFIREVAIAMQQSHSFEDYHWALEISDFTGQSVVKLDILKEVYGVAAYELYDEVPLFRADQIESYLTAKRAKARQTSFQLNVMDLPHPVAQVVYRDYTSLKQLADRGIRIPLGAARAFVYRTENAPYEVSVDEVLLVLGQGSTHTTVDYTFTKLKSKMLSTGPYAKTNDASLKKLNKKLSLPQKIVAYQLLIDAYIGGVWHEKDWFEAAQLTCETTIRGWHDAKPHLTPAQRWAVFLAGKNKQELDKKYLAHAYLPVGISELVGPAEKGYPFKTYEGICEWGSIPPYTNSGNGAPQRAAAQLTRLFTTDLAMALRFLKGYMAKMIADAGNNQALAARYTQTTVVHDAGQIRLPKAPFDTAFWASFLTANPQITACAQFFAMYEQTHGKPTKVSEFMAKIGALAYSDVPEGMEEFACYCHKLKLPESDFHEILDKGLVPKQHSELPDLKVSYRGYSLRMLEPGDARALLIGIETECCQHANGGAAEASAIHSYQESSSGVVVLEKDDELVAQSWVWLAQDDNTIVFDSIESARKDEKSIELAGRMFGQLMKEMLEKGYSAGLSMTGYGMTRDVYSWIKQNLPGVSTEVATPKMKVHCKYSDVGARMHSMNFLKEVDILI